MNLELKPAMNRHFFHLTLLFCAFSFLTSCVSKKKYRTEISNLQRDYNIQIQQLDKQLRVANRAIDTLTSENERKDGAILAYSMTQTNFMNRIDSLRDEIRFREETASSNQKSTNQVVREKEKIIADKDKKIRDVLKLISDRENSLKFISSELLNSMTSLDSLQKHHEVNITDGKVVVTLYESLMFHPGNLRVRTGAVQMLEKVALVLEKYPQFQIIVEGHTDNKPVRGYKSNWDFSAQRASAVVKVLAEEYGLSPNKFSAVGKGEFSPKASNEMSEGRATNRRIEIEIRPRTDLIMNQVKRTLR